MKKYCFHYYLFKRATQLAQKSSSKNNKLKACIQLLENIGIRVEEKDDLSQKIAIIDEKVLWYGNINYLGYTEMEECCMRIEDAKIASEIEGKW